MEYALRVLNSELKYKLKARDEIGQIERLTYLSQREKSRYLELTKEISSLRQVINKIA